MPTEPINVAPENFSGTPEAPKTHNGSVIVDVTNIAKLENAVIKGDLNINWYIF